MTTFRRVCAWCQAVLAEGSPGAPTSHGICPACEAALMPPTDRGPTCAKCGDATCYCEIAANH